MVARRKQELQDQEISDILNESEIEDAEDDEDPTYQEPEIDRAYENVDEQLALDSEDSSSSGDENSMLSTINFRESNCPRIRRQSSVHTRGGVLRRNAVRSRVRTRGGAGAFRISVEDSISWTRSSFTKDLPALLQPSYRPSEPKPSIIGYFYEYIDEDLRRELSPILTRLFRLSLATGHVPKAWKQANVQPVPKKGSRADPVNYRPISVTSILCKSMERILNYQLLAYLEANDLLSDRQYGFRRNRSTGDLLAYATHIWNETIERHGAAIAVSIDISKAFDRVWHDGLISKLSHTAYPPRFVSGYLTS